MAIRSTRRARRNGYRRGSTISPSILLLLFSSLVFVGGIVAEAAAFIPPPYTQADVEFTGQMSVDGASLTVTINTANKIGLVEFSGTAGQIVSLGVNSTTFSTSSDLYVYNPDATTLTWSTSLSTSTNFHMTLPATGTYTIMVDPYSTSTGNVTLTLSSEVNAGTIVVDGSSVTATISRVGQRARMTFSGTAGQIVSLGVNSTTLSSASDIFVYNPDGTTLTWSSALSTSTNFHMTLPAAGTYTIMVDPNSTSTGTTTLTLSSEVNAGTIVVDGSSVTVTINRVGQRARMTFSGTAGQIVSLGVNSTTLSSASDIFVYNPDGTTLTWSSALSTSTNFHMTLPAAGTYTIMVDPNSTSTGSTTLTLSSEVNAGTIVVDGSSVTATISRVGQRARMTFSGTAGQKVSLGVNAITPASGTDLYILNPDGSALTSTTSTTTSTNFHMTLPATGTYTILVDPDAASTGSTTLTLSSEINAGSLTVNGGSAPVTIGRVGQRARYNFSGGSGQQVTVNVTGNTMGSVTVQMLKPDGTQQTASTSSASSFNLATQTLAATGTYTIYVDPASTNTGSMNVAVTGTTVATKLAVTSVNSGSAPTAGAGFPVVVQAQDAGGAAMNVTANTGVSLSLKTGAGTLGGTLTGTIAAGSNQVTISGVTYTKSESGVVITATRTSGDTLTAGDSAPFTVNPGAASALAFTTQPGNVGAGNNIPGAPAVTVQDSLGNTVTSSTASITIAIGTNPAGGTLSGTTTKNAASGMASFTDLTLDKVGTGYTLTASATGLAGATSSAFNISAGAAAALVFSTQPTNANVGSTIPGPPTVTVQDSVGNTVTSSTASITVAIGTNPGGGTLSGTTTKNAVSGVASFTDLSIDQSGNGYTLSGSSVGLTTATSGVFNITPTTTGTIAGTVVRASDGTPIGGALVEALQSGLLRGSATSGANGSYSIPNLLAGTYDVRTSAGGFVTQTPTGISLTGGSSTTVNFSLNSATAGVGVVYIYDRVARLRAGVDLATDTAIFNYDSVGNLLSIQRQSSSVVSVIEISTNTGSSGTTVTIFGTGFSSTCGQNTVTFNGTPATVASCTATQIVTNVPAGAISGPINVTAPGGSASSTENFNVTASSGAPVIASFNPTIGSSGTSVSVAGSGFDAIPTNNRITLNISRSDATSATATSIATAVPNAATSGRISIATPAGKGVSTDDFFVPPFQLTAADVGYTSRMSIGGNNTVSITSGNNIGLVTFDGTLGQQVTLNISAVTFPRPVSIHIQSPEGTSLTTGLIGSTGGVIGPITLPSTGTYTILVLPRILTNVIGCCFTGEGVPATIAHLSMPSGIAMDAQGNLFIADKGNNRIRKVDPNGIISTVAGNGVAGFSGDGAPAIYAQLNFPWSVTVDNQGNLFIADFSNHRVRKVNTSGVITTVAGNGTPGYSGDGGPATNAQLNGPGAVAVDAQGNLFIADYDNHRVRKVATNGTITTVAGTGIGGYSGDGGLATSAQVNQPAGVALDAQDNLLIADYSNHRIRKVDIGGVITTVAGNGTAGFSGDGGAASSAQLNFPSGVGLDTQGNLFITDERNYRIRRVDTLGIIATVAGNGTWGFAGDAGPAINAQLINPWATIVDASGNLFISDTGNDRIRKVDTSGIINSIAGTDDVGDGGLAKDAVIDYPTGVATDSQGNIYVADYGLSRVRKIAPNGIITTVAGDGTYGYGGDGGPATSAQIKGPWQIALDSQGNLYIADDSDSRIRKVDTNGIITTVAGTGVGGYSGDGGPATSARLHSPQGVAVDSLGNVYVGDTFNDRIRKIDTSGIITTFAGTGAHGYNGDNIPATSAQFKYPIGLAVDSNDNVYIADESNNRIRKVNTAGTITTVAGNGVFGYSGENLPATGSSLSFPQGVAVDSQGNIYIAEEEHRVRKVNTGGMISTLTGSGEGGFNGDNIVPTLAQVNFPTHVAVNGQGNIYIADSNNFLLRGIYANATGSLTLTLTTP